MNSPLEDGEMGESWVEASKTSSDLLGFLNEHFQKFDNFTSSSPLNFFIHSLVLTA